MNATRFNSMARPCALCCLLLNILVVSATCSASLLNPGDLQIVRYQADTPDQFSFVIWKTLDQGTEIHFTDQGWLSSQQFRGSEGLLSWQATTSVAAGTVISIDVPELTASMGQLNPNSNMQLSSSGDQLFAFQGSLLTPQFLFGLQMEGTTWDPDAANASQTSLPPSLDSEIAQLHFNEEWDNAIYTGPIHGASLNELQLAITSPEHWQLSNHLQPYPIIRSFSWPAPASQNPSARPLRNGASLWLWLMGLAGLTLTSRAKTQKIPSTE